jgi:amino acid transporter
MVISTIMNSLMTFAYMLAILFCIGDAERVFAAPNPLVEVFYLATKSKGATTVVILMHAFICLVALFNIVASACRLTWAFARDKGLPYQDVLTRVSCESSTAGSDS